MSVRPLPADHLRGRALAGSYDDWLGGLTGPAPDPFPPTPRPTRPVPPNRPRARGTVPPPTRHSMPARHAVPPAPVPPPTPLEPPPRQRATPWPDESPIAEPNPPLAMPPKPRVRGDWRVPRHAAGPDDLPPEPRYVLTLVWTMCWYVVPYLLFAAWTLTFQATPATACAKPTGNTCPSPRTAALHMLLAGAPKLGVALGIAMLLALLIRLGSAAWRPITAAFSAAIVGAGAATILFSVLAQSH